MPAGPFGQELLVDLQNKRVLMGLAHGQGFFLGVNSLGASGPDVGRSWNLLPAPANAPENAGKSAQPVLRTGLAKSLCLSHDRAKRILGRKAVSRTVTAN